MAIQNDVPDAGQQVVYQQQQDQATKAQAFDAAVKDVQSAADRTVNNVVHLSQQMNSPVDQARNHQVDTLQGHGMGAQPGPQQVHLDQIAANRPNFDPHMQPANAQVPQNPALDPSQLTNFLSRVYKIGHDVLASILKRFVPGVRDGDVGYEVGKNADKGQRGANPNNKG